MISRIATVVSILLFEVFPLQAQTSNWQQTNGPYAPRIIRRLLSHPSGDIFCFSRALYSDNYLLRSSNQGQTWSDVNRTYVYPATGGSTTFRIEDLFIHKDGALYASVSGVGVLRSTNKGATWEKFFDRLGAVTSFALLGMNSSGHIFAKPFMSSDGYIYCSTNSGSTWERRENGLDMRFPANVNLSVDAYDNLYLRDFNNKLYGSTDNGAQWSVLYAGSADFVTVHSRGVLFLGSTNSTNYTAKLLRSTDQGVTWADIYPDIYSKKIRILNMLPGPSGQVILCTRDSLLISADLGDTWKPASIVVTGESINEVSVTPAGEILVGTDAGWLHRSVNGGLSWTRSTARWERFAGIACLASNSRNTLFAGSSSDGFFTTTDQGSSWNAAATSVIGTSVNSLAVSANDRLYLGTSSNGLFESSDDGTTWKKMNTPFATRSVSWIGLNSKGHIFVVAQADLFRSTDNGVTWDSKATSTSVRYMCAAIGPSDDLYASFSDDMYYSSNGGDAWVKKNSGLPPSPAVTALTVGDHGEVWLGTSTGGLFFSADQGGTWVSKPTGLRGPSNKIKNILCLPHNQLMINVDAAYGYVGIYFEDFGIFHSTNNGSTWRFLNTSVQYSMETASSIHRMRDNKVLAGLAHGVMIWTPTATSAIGQVGQSVTQFVLDQNYPNPFNPNTTIRYAIPKPANVSLTIITTLGQEVATLVEGYKKVGEHQVQWKANVPSGIYFYRLQAGEFAETKKMILLR